MLLSLQACAARPTLVAGAPRSVRPKFHTAPACGAPTSQPPRTDPSVRRLHLPPIEGHSLHRPQVLRLVQQSKAPRPCRTLEQKLVGDASCRANAERPTPKTPLALRPARPPLAKHHEAMSRTQAPHQATAMHPRLRNDQSPAASHAVSRQHGEDFVAKTPPHLPRSSSRCPLRKSHTA